MLTSPSLLQQHLIHANMQRTRSWAHSLSSAATEDLSEAITSATANSSNSVHFIYMSPTIPKQTPKGEIVQARIEAELKLNRTDKKRFQKWMKFWHPSEEAWLAQMSPAHASLRYTALVDEWRMDCKKWVEIPRQQMTPQDLKFIGGIYAHLEPKSNSWWPSWY